AAICAMQPQVLLLDEPTSHLDPQGTRDILRIVKKLNSETGITVVLATHRTKEVAPLCNHVWLMEDGRICLDLPKADAFQDVTPYQRLGVQVPVDAPSNAPTSPLKPAANVERQEALLNIQNLHFRYPNTHKDAVCDISCEVPRGEVLAIMGANGSGKTTLIHLIAGLLRSSAGEITIDGKPCSRVKLHQLAGKVGIVFQDPDLLLQAETVRDEVAFGPKNLKFPKKDLEKRVDRTLTRFDLQNLGSEAPYALSRGQRQRSIPTFSYSMNPPLVKTRSTSIS
ncbi:ATP-binding cassette domain-containing protein, partial [Candidatus Poribacteria bacterium]|nr:ATP-binding cassette domain-containing protein [Candidatus Poribacteria bacterium]